MKLIITIIILCFMLNNAFASDNAITTADEAFAKALKYTGFDKIESIVKQATSENVRIETLTDTTTPYLKNETNGKKVWSVEFKDVVLHGSKVNPKFLYREKKNFVVLLDSLTGKLLKVIAWSAGDNRHPEPSASVAEKQMRDEYVGFLDYLPEADLLKILMAKETLGKAVLATDIYAVCVMYISPYTGFEPIPVWSITFKGGTGVSPTHDIILPKDQATTWRLIVDAGTGKRICGTPDPYIPDNSEAYEYLRD